ncbi:MAG TPA: DUF4265 domain-containing protein [Usitatibacter sp.]|nr:DUF4265 domain-containing protein [Usitatibacter sp.]
MAGTEEKLEHVILNVNDTTFGTTGERVWALPLGDDLYEIRNTPWHTCEVAWGDIVKALADSDDHWPTMVEVVARSGHRTLQVFFHKETPDGERTRILNSLNQLHASYEHARGSLYAIDVESQHDFEAICEYLDELETKDLLGYRTLVD